MAPRPSVVGDGLRQQRIALLSPHAPLTRLAAAAASNGLLTVSALFFPSGMQGAIGKNEPALAPGRRGVFR